MKKCVWIVIIQLFSATISEAQVPIIGIITGVIKKVIKATDLKIQRLQNETIWLQNAQKGLENNMSKLKLGEISDWSQKQKDLYQQYFDELSQVKTIISSYQQAKDISRKQALLVSAYQRAWQLLKSDQHFTAEEITYMQRVYTGILDESVKNLDQVLMAITALSTQMQDAERLKIIHEAAEKLETNYNDLKEFNAQNALLSIQRAKDANDLKTTKALYNLQ